MATIVSVSPSDEALLRKALPQSHITLVPPLVGIPAELKHKLKRMGAEGVAQVRQRGGGRAVLGAVLAQPDRQCPFQRLLILLRLPKTPVVDVIAVVLCHEA